MIEKIKKILSNSTRAQFITSGFIFLALSITLISILQYLHFNTLSKEIETLSINIANLEDKLSSTTNTLQASIDKTHSSLSNALNEEKQNVGNIAQSLGSYRQEVGSYTSTVSNLQKLSKTDPQLLAKYSKIFFLNENYATASFSTTPSIFISLKMVNFAPKTI